MKCFTEEFSLNYKTPEDFTRCFWQKQERVLIIWVIYRFSMSLFWLGTFGTVIYFFSEDNKHANPLKFLIFLTYWVGIILEVYFICMTYITTKKYVSEKKYIGDIEPMKKMPWMYKITWICYTMSLSFSLVTTIIYWTKIYDPDIYPKLYRGFLLRGINIILLVVDFFLSATPLRMTHFYICVVLGLLYSVFSYIYFLCGGTGINNQQAIYSILDWNHPLRAAFTCFFISVFVVVLFPLIALMNRVKPWLKQRKWEIHRKGDESP